MGALAGSRGRDVVLHRPAKVRQRSSARASLSARVKMLTAHEEEVESRQIDYKLRALPVGPFLLDFIHQHGSR